MKHILWPFTAFLLLESEAQTTISTDDHLNRHHTKTYLWVINNDTVRPGEGPVNITVNHPLPDLILFYNLKENTIADTIYTRFSKNQDYLLAQGCGGSPFELHHADSTLRKKPTYVPDPKTMEPKLVYPKETGLVKFSVKNKPEKDTLIVMYTDFKGIPHALMVSENKQYNWLPPSKGHHSTNIDNIVIAKKKPGVEYEFIHNDLITWDYTNHKEVFETIKSFQIRVFNEEKVFIQYDHADNTASIKFDK